MRSVLIKKKMVLHKCKETGKRTTFGHKVAYMQNYKMKFDSKKAKNLFAASCRENRLRELYSPILFIVRTQTRTGVL